MFQPQIIDSLFANKTFLLFLIKKIVGSKPAMPGIATTVMSDLMFLLFNSS